MWKTEESTQTHGFIVETESKKSFCLDGKLNHSIVDGVVSSFLLLLLLLYCVRFFLCILFCRYLTVSTTSAWQPRHPVVRSLFPLFYTRLARHQKEGFLLEKFWNWFPCTNIWRMQSFLNTLGNGCWSYLKYQQKLWKKVGEFLNYSEHYHAKGWNCICLFTK